MSKVVVTGGAGFVGSHIVNRLLRDGYEVVVVDNLSTGFKDYLPDSPKLTFLQIDITNWNELTRNASYFKGAHTVFHLAACARIQPSIYAPMLTHDTNVTGTINVLEIMRLCDIKNIVYSASSSYYGLEPNVPSKETEPSDCQTPYSVSKYHGELYCSTWSKLYKINSVRLRYFNVWGPRSPIAGPYAPVVSLFFRQALYDGKPITVVGDGLQRRDFTHVEDVVEANVLAMNHMQSNAGTVNDTFNIGTGKNYSILEIANMVKSTVEKLIPMTTCTLEHIPERIGEARTSLADNTKAKNVLGWYPKCSIENKIEELFFYYYGSK